MDRVPIGEQIRKVRLLKGYTQAQLALHTQLSIDTINKIETGANINPTIYVIKVISKALDNVKFDIYEH